MIKYPPYKKNAQGQKRALYPGLTTVSLDRIINLCDTTTFWHIGVHSAFVTTANWTQNLLIYYTMCLWTSTI